MKFLHIMKREKFTVDISKFYDVYFREKGHEICYINSIGEESLVRKHLIITQREIFFVGNIILNISLFYRVLKPYDYIVFHSYQFSGYVKLFLAINHNLLKKVVWIEWGADLYQWKENGTGIKGFFKRLINKRIRSKCNSVVCIFPPDCDVYRKEFPKSKAKVYYAPYCGATVPEEYKIYNNFTRLTKTKKENDSIYIQVGHGATEMVRHIEVLDSLKNFSGENIRIFLPLSYGDQNYADKVQNYAETLFPGKVICLRNMMPKEEYFELMSRVDIAIFNTYRQIGLGNINRMIFRNVKLYMPEDSVMYKYFVLNGVPIQKFEDISSCGFKEFKKEVIIENKEVFMKFIEGFRDMDAKVELWKNIYDDLQVNGEGQNVNYK